MLKKNQPSKNNNYNSQIKILLGRETNAGNVNIITFSSWQLPEFYSCQTTAQFFWGWLTSVAMFLVLFFRFRIAR